MCSTNGDKPVHRAPPPGPGRTVNRSAVAAKPPNVPSTADGGWLVSGDDTATIGELANTHHIPLHELSPRCDSRYEVYTRMTGVAVLVTGTNSLPPDDTILGGALGNAVIGQIAAGAVGVLAVCGEYSSGTIRATLAACPRRVTVLIATSLVVAALMFTVAVTAALFAYQAGSLMLAGQGHPPGQPMPALLGIALSHAAVAILGVALGTAMRHTAGATSAITSILLLPTLLGPLLGSGQRWGDGTSPVAAMQKLAQPLSVKIW